MEHIKREPLEYQDCRNGTALETAVATARMENSTSSGCVMGQPRDSVADNVSREHRQVEEEAKLEIMHDEEDPLIRETINALINGTGGIEVVAGPEVTDDIDNERNYECNFCGKLFTRSNTLSYHLKVHNDEKPYKCGNCDKAFRERYRLTKHQKTHVKDLTGNAIQQLQDQETEHSQDSSFPSTSGRTAEEEDYTTGDSERFFKNYEMQEGTAALKLEPDISLTVDGTSTNPGTQSSSSENDVRYQIIEERIKSLQREVHLVNQNLNRVETKLDGLTKIIAIFINKFDDTETQPSNNSNVAPAVLPLPVVTIPIENLPAIQPHAATVQHQEPPQPQAIQMIHPASMVASIQQPTTTPIASGNSSAVLSHPQHSNNDTFPEVPELPIRTVNDFLDLNDHCTDNEQFLLQMMIRLHQEVDNSQPHQRNVKKMMEALVTYEVLCQFSWSGKSAINGQYTKYVFGNSVGIIDLLTKTLNLGRSDEEAQANQKPILTAIQSFIKHSRQNMLRDSRKRRESATGGSVYPPALGCTPDRLAKQIKPEQQEPVSQF